MASLGYETQDAVTYAEWGVDYLKVQSVLNVSPAFFFTSASLLHIQTSTSDAMGLIWSAVRSMTIVIGVKTMALRMCVFKLWKMPLTRLDETCFIPYAHGELVSIINIHICFCCYSKSKPCSFAMMSNYLYAVLRKHLGLGITDGTKLSHSWWYLQWLELHCANYGRSYQIDWFRWSWSLGWSRYIHTHTPSMDQKLRISC